MRAYWQRKLEGVPALKLPADFRKAAPFRRAVGDFTLDQAIVSALTSAARRHGATLYMAMVSCLKVLLYRHTAQEDFAIGTPVSARPLPELEPQIGPYLNILALRDHLTGADTLGAVLLRVRDTTLDGFAHQLYPFDRIVEDLRIRPVAGRNPLFDAGFTLQNQHDVQARDGSRHLRMTELARASDAFDDPEAATDLWFVARPDERGLAVQVVYNGARFRPERIDRLSRDFVAIASAASASLDSRVDAVTLASSPQPRRGRTITIDLGL
jgi:non-ribosomal peptide synthetase component F